MTHKLRIDHLRILSPGVDFVGSLLLEGSKIAALIPQGENLPAADEIIDGEGQWAVPGFIDIHAHGANGHDTCDGTENAIREIAKAKVKEGVTTWLPTTLTLPYEQLESAFSAVAAYQKKTDFADVVGVHFEGPYIHPQAVGAQNPDFVRAIDFTEIDKLHAIAPMKIISMAPDMPGAIEACGSLVQRGIVPSAAHTKATKAEIMAAKQQGLQHLTHFCNQMTPLHHREIGVVGAGLLDDELMIEMIADKIHLCSDMIDLVWKLKPAKQLMLVTDSMRASWLEDGQETQLGGLKVIVQEGAARLESGALAGSTARFYELFANVLEITKQSPANVICATAWNQARSLGLTDRGRLLPGLRADIALLHPETLQPQSTWVEGVQRF